MFVSQTITRPVGVNAFGSNVIRVEPDYAVVSFAVQHVAAAPAVAIDAVEKSRRAVATVLEVRALTGTAVTTSRMRLGLAAEGFGDRRKVVGYQAELGYDVVCHELARVSELVIALVDAGAKVIHGVDYHSSRIRELRAKARENAIASARLKAEGYAKAAGATLGRVLHIEDVNPESLLQRGHLPDIDSTLHDELDGTGAGSINVIGAVMTCFALLDG